MGRIRIRATEVIRLSILIKSGLSECGGCNLPQNPYQRPYKRGNRLNKSCPRASATETLPGRFAATEAAKSAVARNGMQQFLLQARRFNAQARTGRPCLHYTTTYPR